MTLVKARTVSSAALCEALLRQSPGCAFVLRPDRLFQSVYGDAPRVFGRAAAELEETSFIDCFEPETRGPWIARVERAFGRETVCANARGCSITLFPLALPEPGTAFVGGAARVLAERDMVHRVLEHVENDRTRLFHFLHDHVGQYLSAVGLQLDLLRMDLSEAQFPIAERTAQIQLTLDTVMKLVRDFNSGLNPAIGERIGLRAAMDVLAGHLRTGFKGNVRVLSDGAAQPSPEQAAALYRIAQEAASNAIRHASCSAIEILIKSMRNGTALEVRDNGSGFEVDGALTPPGVGLQVMQFYADRANIDLEICSTPGTGTVVRALCRAAERSI